LKGKCGAIAAKRQFDESWNDYLLKRAELKSHKASLERMAKKLNLQLPPLPD